MLAGGWRVQPRFEFFEALHPNKSWLVFHDPGGIGLDLSCGAALMSGFGFVALDIGKGCGCSLAKQHFLLVAGWTPPRSIKEGPLGFEFKAEGFLLRTRGGQRFGRNGPVARRGLLGDGSSSSPTGCSGTANAQKQRAEGNQKS